MCRVQKVEGEESFEIDLVIAGNKFTTKIQSEGDISNMVVNFLKENPECEKHSGKIQKAFQEVLSKYGKEKKEKQQRSNGMWKFGKMKVGRRKRQFDARFTMTFSQNHPSSKKNLLGSPVEKQKMIDTQQHTTRR